MKQFKEQRESIISNQIGRSGTSIDANIHEAQYAQGKKDFISKLEIALKEASETGYWLELLHRTNYIDEKQYKILSDKCATLRVMLVSSCRTVKAGIDNKSFSNIDPNLWLPLGMTVFPSAERKFFIWNTNGTPAISNKTDGLEEADER